MQLEFAPEWNDSRPERANVLSVGSARVLVQYIRNPRARRYVLRVRRDGTARVTVPRGGSIAFAFDFARKHSPWIEEQLRRQREERERATWRDGSEIAFRGKLVAIRVESEGGIRVVHVADHSFPLSAHSSDLRPALENYLWSLAEKELLARTMQLAAQYQILVRRVIVRNQRSRWGSCSAKGTISLNWRLIQAPGYVRDYLIVHELMHLREMNHSRRFWSRVEAACPEYADAEAWLDQHADLLR